MDRRDGEYRAVGVLEVADADSGAAEATENADQITLVPEQLEPLVHRLDGLNYDLTFGDV